VAAFQRVLIISLSPSFPGLPIKPHGAFIGRRITACCDWFPHRPVEISLPEKASISFVVESELAGGYERRMVRTSGCAVVEHEAWLLHGKLHRLDEPAVIKRDRETGAVIAQEWWTHGVQHRDGAPAGIAYDPLTGVIVYEEWIMKGIRHREGAPAVLQYHPATRIVVHEQWYEHGLFHRLGGPDSTYRDGITGAVLHASWFRHGRAAAPPRDQRRLELERFAGLRRPPGLIPS